MWLINVEKYHLEHFIDDRHAPPYAILSHTWGSEEVSFQEFRGINQRVREKAGFRKIRFACEQASQETYEGSNSPTEVLRYLWVDTCCIDKTSSAELSEAINSMFEWYRQARVCFAYLEDVDIRHVRKHLPLDTDLPFPINQSFTGPGTEQAPSDTDRPLSANEFTTLASHSRWFTRGWTLQELLAPDHVKFFASNWSYLGSKRDHLSSIADITRIPVYALRGSFYIWFFSIAARLSWASGRSTTRVEDMAYSLLGLLGVNMPLIYGEREQAFTRLQEETLRRSSDESMFTWTHCDSSSSRSSIFADDVSQFAHCGTVVRDFRVKHAPKTSLTNLGLEIEGEVSCNPIRESRRETAYLRLPYKDGRSNAPIYIRIEEVLATHSKVSRSRDLIPFFGWGTGHGPNRYSPPQNYRSQGLQKLVVVESYERVPRQGVLDILRVLFESRSVMFGSPDPDDCAHQEQTYMQVKSLNHDYGVTWEREVSWLSAARFEQPPLWDAVLHLSFELYLSSGKQASFGLEKFELTIKIDLSTGERLLQFECCDDISIPIAEQPPSPYVEGSKLLEVRPGELQHTNTQSGSAQVLCKRGVLRAEMRETNHDRLDMFVHVDLSLDRSW